MDVDVNAVSWNGRMNPRRRRASREKAADLTWAAGGQESGAIKSGDLS